MTPTEYFDQFVPHLQEAGVQGGSNWCARHWAPCPLAGANGMGASVELMEAFLHSQPPTATAQDLNAALEVGGPACCQLGDEKMFTLWSHWPPLRRESDPRA